MSLHLTQCSVSSYLRKIIPSGVSQSNKNQSKKPKGNIVLIELNSKNLMSLNLSASNLTDNIHFALQEAKFEIIRYKNSNFSTNPIDKTLETKETPENSQKIPNEFKDKDYIIKLCKEKGAKYLLSGFIFEADVGTILDEDYSSGVILYLYDSDGILLNQYKYIGSDRLLSFESNSKIADKLAKVISDYFN